MLRCHAQSTAASTSDKRRQRQRLASVVHLDESCPAAASVHAPASSHTAAAQIQKGLGLVAKAPHTVLLLDYRQALICCLFMSSVSESALLLGTLLCDQHPVFVARSSHTATLEDARQSQ